MWLTFEALAERQLEDNGEYVVRWKFAFKWCDKQPSPWWIQEEAPSPDGIVPTRPSE